MKPLWISHRGFTESAIENSLEAFQAAVALGFTALETDLRLTCDGHVVLHHDPNLIRITGSSAQIASKTRTELELIRPKLSFLDEFIAEFSGYSWTFDIKPETGDGVINELIKLVRRGGDVAHKIAHARYVTWTRRHQVHLGRLFPNAILYALERECWRAGIAIIARLPSIGGLVPGRAYAVPPRVGKKELFQEALVKAYHQRGARILAYLPRTDAEAQAAYRAGFDEILTNGKIVEDHPVKA